MAKRKETLELEEKLEIMAKEKGIYGCREVTIGFIGNGFGKEIVDFLTMDSKGILRAYEIKVTLSDLKSKAKLSWHAHYNYLVISEALYKEKDTWEHLIPDFVGILKEPSLLIVKRPKKQKIEEKMEVILKESLVRSMYYKMEQYKDANNLEKQKKARFELNQVKKERDLYLKKYKELERYIFKYETYTIYNKKLEDFNFEEEVEKEYQLYKENRRNSLRERNRLKSIETRNP